MIVRQATPSDAGQMVVILNELILAGGTTAHGTLFTEAMMSGYYIKPSRCVSSFVAEIDGLNLGFQSVEWSDPDLHDKDSLPADWASIATFVRIGQTGKGVGSALFAQTRLRAKEAGVVTIDATIRTENTGGQIFYARMGFKEYRRFPTAIGTRFDL